MLEVAEEEGEREKERREEGRRRRRREVRRGSGVVWGFKRPVCHARLRMPTLGNRTAAEMSSQSGFLACKITIHA